MHACVRARVPLPGRCMRRWSMYGRACPLTTTSHAERCHLLLKYTILRLRTKYPLPVLFKMMITEVGAHAGVCVTHGAQWQRPHTGRH